MTAYDENVRRLKSIANEKNLVFNPDPARAQKVIGLMTENFETVGEYVCPCKQTHHPPIKGKDVLCPCSDMMNEIAQDGHCHCRLFYTPEAAEAEKASAGNSPQRSCCGNE